MLFVIFKQLRKALLKASLIMTLLILLADSSIAIAQQSGTFGLVDEPRLIEVTGTLKDVNSIRVRVILNDQETILSGHKARSFLYLRSYIIFDDSAARWRTTDKYKSWKRNRRRFVVTHNAGIVGYNNETHQHVTLSRCKIICLTKPWCKSVDFRRADGTCYVQPVNRNDVPLKRNYPGNPFDHYSLLP